MATKSDVKELLEAFPPSDKLRKLADVIDCFYPFDPDPEMQEDIRAWAEEIDRVQEKFQKTI